MTADNRSAQSAFTCFDLSLRAGDVKQWRCSLEKSENRLIVPSLVCDKSDFTLVVARFVLRPESCATSGKLLRAFMNRTFASIGCNSSVD